METLHDNKLLNLKSGSLILILATTVSMIWGVTLLMEPANTASLNGLLLLFGNHYFAGAFCLFAAGSAVLFLMPNICFNIPCTMGLLLPQQFILMIASLTSFHCVMQGEFSDGVQRSAVFILSDQAWVILLAYFHWIAIVTWIHEKMLT